VRLNSITVFLILFTGIYPIQDSYALPGSVHGFIENKGQIVDQNYKPNADVLYLLNTPGLNVQLRKTGFSYDVYKIEYKDNTHRLSSMGHDPLNHALPSDSLIPEYHFHRIDITLHGANPDCRVVPSEQLPDYFNYFTASAPPEGIRNIGQYSKVTYQNIYPGIDLEFFTSDEHGYKYNFVIHPGANIRDIRLRIQGPDHISLVRDTLKFGTRFGEMEELIPESYYIVNNAKVDFQARFEQLNDELFGFSSREVIPENSLLVIDPTAIRLWGTYYGGINEEWEGRCASDNYGNVFLAGTTMSTNNIASAGAYQGTLAGSFDCFLAKFTVAGQRLWGTYLGGPAWEFVRACVVDQSGNIYFSGETQSTFGIASSGSHQQVFGGGPEDCFIEKFNQAGDRLWGTYYGGDTLDYNGVVTVDKHGNVFLTGETYSDTGISTQGSYQPNRYNNSEDAFLAKFDSNGVRQWGTYYGGEGGDAGSACTIDKSGNVYFGGGTTSQSNIASPGAFQPVYGGGYGDAFLAKFTTNGQRLWATYYGGSSYEEGFNCTSDSSENAYLVGRTNSTNGIASPGCFQPVYGGGTYDAFIVKFDSLGQRQWGTYYGGSYWDEALYCSIGWNNEVFLAGATQSANNISTPDSYQPDPGGGNQDQDGMLIKFNSDGQRQWGTYYGGTAPDDFWKLSYVQDDTLYLAGDTYSTANIASTHAWQEVEGGNRDCMLIKFLDCWPMSAGPISGPDTICKPSNAVTYSIPPLVHAISYLWAVSPGMVTVSGQGTPSITVDVSGFSGLGMISAKGFNKCNTFGDSAYLQVLVSDSPVPFITGPNNTCAGPGHMYLTTPGMTNYQWSTSAGGVVTSGGTTSTATITWNIPGNQHVYVNYTDANGCSAQTSTDFPVLVTSSPAVNVTISSSANTICAGTQVTYTAAPVNGGGNPTFQWQVNGATAGINADTYSYTPANNDIVRCILTSSITGCIMNNPDTSNTITMIVNPILNVSVSITSSANPVCSGTSVTFTATPTNGGSSPAFQWKVNGINAGTNSMNFTYSPLDNDVVSCVLTSSIANCITNNPSASNTITMAVNPNLPVSLSVSPSANPVCTGTSVTFTANPINEGSAPVYQWKVNGNNVGTNNTTYTYIPVNGDVITCVLTSNAVCASGNPAVSNTVTMTVNPNLPVSLSILPSANPVCSAATVLFTTNTTNGGNLPSFQWKVNGIGVGSNTSTYSYIPVNGDIITCILTSNAICPTGNPATSNAVTMTVNPNLPVSIYITASANPFCSGSSVTFTATPTNEGSTPAYQWKVNGVNTGTSSSTFTYNPVNGDQVSCILTSSMTCTLNNPASSNTLTMAVINSLPAGVTITANPNPFCPGSTVNYAATPVNGGSAPQYQWKVNGTNQGSNSPNYSYTPQVGDSIRCVLTSNLSCVTNNPASSNKIVMSSLPVASVSFTLCFDSITTINAAAFRLKGGVPIGGVYSGPGVNSLTSVFTPSSAGIGTKTITYSYTNMYSCSALMIRNIIVQAAPSFNCGQNLTDIRDNKVYPTVQIGSQCWMQKNLNYGTSLQGTTEQIDNCIIEKYCYNDNTANCTLYGGLYQWDELMAYSNTPGAQGLCPPGWHIPTQSEWNTLFTFYQEQALAGKPLQDSIFNGFRAKESGIVYSNISWKFQGFATLYWTSNSYGAIKALSHGMNLQNFSVSDYYSNRSNAFAVRCLKD